MGIINDASKSGGRKEVEPHIWPPGLTYLEKSEITEIAILQLTNNTQIVINTDILCEIPRSTPNIPVCSFYMIFDVRIVFTVGRHRRRRVLSSVIASGRQSVFKDFSYRPNLVGWCAVP